MSKGRSFTQEEERMRLQGLRILARMIARRHLASSGLDAGDSPVSQETPPADGGQTAGENPDRNNGAA